MNKTKIKPYLHAGITAFVVIFVSTIVFFLMAHIKHLSDQVALIGHILRPISLGLIFAFLLLPIHNRILRFLTDKFGRSDRKIHLRPGVLKGISILLSLLFVFAVLYILLAMVIPQVYLSIVGLVQSIPEYIVTAQNWIMKYLDDNPEIQQIFISAYTPIAVSVEKWLNNEIIPNLSSLSTTLEWLRDSILPNITGMISNVSSLLFQLLMVIKDIFIGIIVSIYLLASKDVFAAQSKKIVYSLFRPQHGDLIIEETRNAYRIMSGFINGKLLDSLIIGIITLICCNLFNFPYAALVAMIIGVTNIIPFFGPFIGAIPSALLILLVDPMKCLYFCIFILILQQFDGNILGPKILGESTGLSSFWVLFSILLFGGLFGFAGMVLGVPCFAIIYSILRRLVNNSLRRRNLSCSTDDYMGVTPRLYRQATPAAESAPDTAEAVKESAAPESEPDAGADS